jgi:pimeloyl-ACP methyl ester carboxylesterase
MQGREGVRQARKGNWESSMEMSAIKYNRVDVDGFGVAYREAGPVGGPALLLLHGFPTSSHMFRNLIPKLADRYRVVAPDLPGFGQSDLPSREQFKYTFSNLAKVMARFTEVLKLNRFAMYVFDYGAPTGLRIAIEYPERVTALITQNGNAYVEGLSDGWNPIRAYWKEPTQANRDALRMLLTPETTYWQYTTGVKDASLVSPDGYNLDNYYMARAGAHEAQLDLFLDYASNVEMYPKFQEYFRQNQPSLLAVWGNRDPFFVPAGAEAFKRDIKNAKVMFFDTGHFALETHCNEIARAIRDFLPGGNARIPRGDETLQEV